MPRSRKEKRQHSDSAPEQRARVLKNGGYNGAGSSRDFRLSGHSSGNQNSEMEALSHQVSIDAGRVPDYPIDETAGSFEFSRRSSAAKTAGLSKDKSNSLPYGKIGIGLAISAAGGALSYLAYRFYQNYQSTQDERIEVKSNRQHQQYSHHIL